LTNIANMPNTVVATFSSQTTWADKLALNTDAGKNAVLTDISLPFTRMAAVTKGVEVPDTVALSPTSYAQLAQTPRTDSSDTTLLDFFLKAHPGVQVVIIPQLESSGTGGAASDDRLQARPVEGEARHPRGHRGARVAAPEPRVGCADDDALRWCHLPLPVEPRFQLRDVRTSPGTAERAASAARSLFDHEDVTMPENTTSTEATTDTTRHHRRSCSREADEGRGEGRRRHREGSGEGDRRREG
jgi:hypothetical protein